MAFTLFKRNPKKLFPTTKHVIEYAFSVAGKDYYKFSQAENQPYERALTCLVYYKELDMNIDAEFLDQHLAAIDKVLTSNPINVFQIKMLNDQLRTRLKLPKDPELLYKISSVVFFDKTENPAVYDYEYNKKKIAFWKENKSLTDFFLTQPLKTLIPYLEYAEKNFDTYSRMIQDVNALHLEKVSEVLSGN